MPYASIAQTGTTFGVVADVAGNFEIKLPAPGDYVLEVRSLGYQTRYDTLTLAADQTLQRSYRLEFQELFISETIVTSDGRDPAYGILREAILRRTENDQRIRAWSARAYTKLQVYDNKEKEIAFLGENFSTLWVKKPNQVREEIHSSRVSGDQTAYNAVGSLFFLINPYDANIENPLFDRPFVTPLSPVTFLHYDVRYLGSYREKGQLVYKIEIWPKRNADPAFRGLVYIAAETYSVVGYDWKVDKRQPLKYLDSLRYVMNYTPLQDQLWVPGNAKVTGRLRLSVVTESVDINASAISVFSDYRISDPPLAPARKATLGAPTGRRASTPKAPPAAATDAPPAAAPAATAAPADSVAPDDPAFFKEILRVDPNVTVGSRNDSIWNAQRPVALTTEELADFKKGDSLEVVRRSPAYRDSVRARGNRITYTTAISGYTYTFEDFTSTLAINGLLDAVQYNTVEGWNVTLRPTLTLRDSADTRYLQLRGALRYGFSNERVSWEGASTLRLDKNRRMFLFLSAGSFPYELSPSVPQIDASLNTFYTLWGRRNLRKQLQQTYGRVQFQRRYGLNLTAAVSAEVAQRTGQVNTSFQDWSRDTLPLFTPNPVLPTHTTYQAGLALIYQPGGRYISLPEGAFRITSPWPVFSLRYGSGRQAREGGGGTTFHRLRATAEGSYSLKLWGTSSFFVQGGYQSVRGDSLLLPDHFHVSGNQVAVAGVEARQFGILDYYTYSSTRRMAELHYEHNFGGFLLNKVPLLRKLKFHELVGLHAVAMPGLPTHAEVNVGLRNIRLFRVSLFGLSYHWVVSGLQEGSSGLRFNIGAQF